MKTTRPANRCGACGKPVVWLYARNDPDDSGNRGVVPANPTSVFPGEDTFRPGTHIRHADTCEVLAARRRQAEPAPALPLATPVQLDIFGMPAAPTPGLAAKAAGQAQALDHAGDGWKDRAAAMIDRLAARMPELTADDVRAEAERIGLPAPAHHAAWGAALTAAGHRGVLRSTMRLKVSTRPAARGHKNPVHESLIYAVNAALPVRLIEEV